MLQPSEAAYGRLGGAGLSGALPSPPSSSSCVTRPSTQIKKILRHLTITSEVPGAQLPLRCLETQLPLEFSVSLRLKQFPNYRSRSLARKKKFVPNYRTSRRL